MTNIELQQVTLEDIPRLGEIAHQAFDEDRHTQLKAQNPFNPYNHGEAMRDALLSWLRRPPGSVDLVKAVNCNEGTIVGWVCWGARNMRFPALSTPNFSLSDQNVDEQSGISVSQPRVHSSTSGLLSEANNDPLADLNILTSASLQDWMQVLMPEGSQCMFIMSIAVDPEFQHQGVGSMLIGHGTEFADQAGAYCWVQSSELGVLLFEKCGFKEIGRLEVDLNPWARRVESARGKKVELTSTRDWGTYVFTYMRREPPQDLVTR